MSNPKPGAGGPSAGAAPGLRMNQLVEKSGLPKSTILLYVKQGLLPAPLKTSPNMAYYAPECVERLAMVRNLQKRHRLPLDKIQKILADMDQGKPVEPLVALMGEIFQAGQGELLNRKELARASGLGLAQIKALEKARVLLPVEPGKYDEQDLNIARVAAGGLEAGIDPMDMSYYAELGEKIVDAEMRVRAKYTGHLPDDENAAFSLRMLQAGRALRTYVLDRLFLLRVAASKDLKDKGLER